MFVLFLPYQKVLVVKHSVGDALTDKRFVKYEDISSQLKDIFLKVSFLQCFFQKQGDIVRITVFYRNRNLNLTSIMMHLQ